MRQSHDRSLRGLHVRDICERSANKQKKCRMLDSKTTVPKAPAGESLQHLIRHVALIGSGTSMPGRTRTHMRRSDG
jgi:hypothetical protein